MAAVSLKPLVLDFQTVCQKTKACTAAYGAATRALKAISKVRPSCQLSTLPALTLLWPLFIHPLHWVL